MHVDLTEDEQQLQKGAIEFARAALAGDMVAQDREAHFDRAAWQRCADFGVLGMPIPETYGGQGLGLSALLAVMEGLGYGTRDQGLLFSINAHLWTNSIPDPDLRHRGRSAQRYLPPSRRRHAHRRQRRLRARRRLRHLQHADARHARRRSTTCSTAPRRSSPTRRSPTCSSSTRRSTRRSGAMGVTGFIVERGTPGLTRRPEARQDGPAHVADGGAHLRGLPHPGDQPARPRGPRRRGLRVLDGVGARLHPRQLPRRDAAAARGRASNTRARASSSASRSASSSRSPTGIVDMKVRLDTCRPLVYRIGGLKDAGKDAAMEAAIAKLYVSECFVKSSLDAVQIFGGYGYMTEQQIERDSATRSAAPSTRAPPRSSATSSRAVSASDPMTTLRTASPARPLATAVAAAGGPPSPPRRSARQRRRGRR